MKIVKIIFALIFLWVAITSNIYWFKNKQKTEMEVFLHMPKSFILDFTEDKQ